MTYLFLISTKYSGSHAFYFPIGFLPQIQGLTLVQEKFLKSGVQFKPLMLRL
jgi:hypothetical protein